MEPNTVNYILGIPNVEEIRDSNEPVYTDLWSISSLAAGNYGAILESSALK